MSESSIQGRASPRLQVLVNGGGQDVFRCQTVGASWREWPRPSPIWRCSSRPSTKSKCGLLHRGSILDPFQLRLARLGQRRQIPNRTQANPLNPVPSASLTMVLTSKIHQGIHLVLGAVPVFCAEGVERQKTDTAFQRPFHHRANRIDAMGVAKDPFLAPALGPTAIAIHDDCHVLRHAVRVDAGRPQRPFSGLKSCWVRGVVIKLPSKLWVFCSPEIPKRTKNTRTGRCARIARVSNPSVAVDPRPTPRRGFGDMRMARAFAQQGRIGVGTTDVVQVIRPKFAGSPIQFETTWLLQLPFHPNAVGNGHATQEVWFSPSTKPCPSVPRGCNARHGGSPKSSSALQGRA